MSVMAGYGIGIFLGLVLLAGLGAGWLTYCMLRALGEWWDYRQLRRRRGGRR